MFRIYKNDTVVAEGESPLSITGLNPDTNVSGGEYQVVRVEDDKESEKVDIPAFKTLPIKVESVSLDQSNLIMEVNDTHQLTAIVAPSNATNKEVAWSSSNAEIATVNSNGLVTAISDGDTIITVATEDGNRTDTCNITVNPEPVITTEEVTEKVDEVPFTTDEVETDELPLGERRTIQEGVNGYTEITYLVTYRDGVEIDREEIERDVTPPVDEVVEVGTYEPEITTEEVTERIDEIEFETVEQENDELPVGERNVIQEGVNGYTEITYLVTYEDGVEISRDEIDRNVIDPIDEIIEVGTYEESEEPDPEEPPEEDDEE